MKKRIVRGLSVPQAIIECVKQERISHLFGVPGESYLPLLDALYDEPTLQFISARHEGGAAFMAEAYAKASGKPGVVLATRGVGAANLAIGVHTARQDSTPLVVLLGQVHRRFRGREGFQEVELDEWFRPLAKWAVEITDPERVPELVQRAFRVAKTGRPGPVVVSIPEDVFTATVAEAVLLAMDAPCPAPADDEVKRIEAALAAARRPLIVAGGGVKRARAEQALRRVAEQYSLPVAAAFRRHDVFPHDHRLYVGHLGLGAPAAVVETAKQADLILAIGTRLSEVTTQDYTWPLPHQTLIHIDIDEEALGKVFSADVAVAADAREALCALSGRQIVPSWNEWVLARRRAYEETARRPQPPRNVQEAIIAELQAQLPDDGVITNDAGNFAGWLHTFFSFKEQHLYIGPTSGAMGYGLPAAIGAKLVHPERPVVSLSGDGGFLMTAAELETASRYGVPVISLVFNNRMYGTIRMYQELQFPGRVVGSGLGAVSFAKLAMALGANGVTVGTVDEFAAAFKQALAAAKPTVIEVMTEPEQLSVTMRLPDR
ncbi:acetolactate synthase [Geobacillus sp. 46C-IIa]|uniref:thiamine pyrophosphate-dependent enzyme n=1 Tax=Geobacillus sp. 46C-IIa TaxID=1963025 RepID=UPI0009C0DFC4|nr:thiamine pyrophosphate-dependent enzyme [Geobacillus sp. 46C-IIa]OQP05672.1 acetolactate synthase [Geobacillus sp. 46C-IIa]QNU27583.1 acetolactate synthase [Geobacillus sp. 46C-IIa]